MAVIAKFVNRVDQKALVNKVLDETVNSDSASLRESGEHRIIEMFGLAGVGKSRMLDEVKTACRDERKLPFVVLDFLPHAFGELEAPLEHVLLAICSQLDHYFDGMASARSHLLPLARQTPRGSNGGRGSESRFASDVDEKMAAVRSELAAVFKKEQKPFITLLDSTEYCPAMLFDRIGRDLFGRMVEEYPEFDLVIFTAGRSARVLDSSWPVFLKKATDTIWLDPLDLAFTEEHIQHLPPEGRYQKATREIYAVSNGHPYSTETLVDWLNRNNIDVSQVGGRKQDLARQLHDQVIMRYVLGKAEAWVLDFITTASVLRRFDAAMLRALLGDQHPINWYIQRLIDLQQPSLHLVEFGDAEPGYYVEPTLAKLLRAAQAILQPDNTIALNRKAQGLWENKLKERVSARFALEAVYHAVQIAAVGGADVRVTAKDTLNQLLAAYFRPVEHAQELSELQDFIARDRELEAFVGTECMTDLKSQGRKHMQPPRTTGPFVYTHLIIDRRPPSELTVTWYAMDQVLLPTEIITSPREIPLERWRSDLEAIGKAAFASYLPRRAQDFMRSRRDWAIQITTDWVDIPWELLHDGEDFLCLNRPIARKSKMLKEPARSDGQWMNRALVVGNPTGDLPGAEAEARAVAGLLKQKEMEVKLLVGPKEATALELQISLANSTYDLIHYAGRGQFDSSAPHMSALEFSDGLYYAEELERSLQGAPLVFLSACEAGQAQTTTSSAGYRGRFVEGLAAAVLVGGASGCLGSIWKIGDGVARKFALAFYAELLDGQAIGEAVRQARLTTRNMSPDFWASWILYGDPFKKLDSSHQ